MTPRYAFILSAGYGTRMGAYGKTCPKPLWPLFDKTQLEFHTHNLFELGFSKVFINAFHQADKVQRALDTFSGSEVELLREEELLGSGGAFHNLARKTKITSPLFSLNVDVFFALTKEDLKRGEEKISSSCAQAYLYPVGVRETDSYNRFSIREEELVEILPPSEVAPKMTFSGCALVDMSKMGKVPGPSSFFKTVANFQSQTVLVDQVCLKGREYWDFGTLENYYLGHKTLLGKKSSALFQKLVSFGGIQESECSGESYRAPRERRVINLSSLSSEDIRKSGVYDALLLPGVGEEEITIGNYERTNQGKVYFPKS